MKRVFIGGSRRLSRLNKKIMDRANNILTNGYEVLIGDANGADKAMQKFFADKNYINVIVYCTGDVCRNNLGNWHTKNIESNRKTKDFQYYTIKDRHMSDDADYGLMLWDGKSKGTLNNIINLLLQKKSVLVYFSSSKEFMTIKNFSDLESLLKKCDPAIIQKMNRDLNIEQHLYNYQSQLSFS